MKTMRHHVVGPLAAVAALACGLAAGLSCAGCQPARKSARSTPARPQPKKQAKEWKELLTETATAPVAGAQDGALFYALDVLTRPASKVELTARLLSLAHVEEVVGATVEFRLGEMIVGQAATDAEGYARLGWASPKAPGEHEFSLKVVGVREARHEHLLNLPPTPLLVVVRDPDAQIIVIDLDYTLVNSTFAAVLSRAADPAPQSVEVAKALARGYTLAYLAHRPNLLTTPAKGWLADHGFPRAPLLVSSPRQFVGNSRKLKTQRLAELRLDFANARIGIGDQLSDPAPYTTNSMRAYLMPHYDSDSPNTVRRLADKIRQLPADVQVVEGWAQVRQGILGGANFPPGAYAERLLQKVPTAGH